MLRRGREDFSALPFDRTFLADRFTQPILESIWESGPSIACGEPLLQRAFRIGGKRDAAISDCVLFELVLGYNASLSVSKFNHNGLAVKNFVAQMELAWILGIRKLRIGCGYDIGKENFD